MTTSCLALAIALVSAPPSEKQLELLKVFRGEFVPITPGEGKFPVKFSMGRAAGPPSERPVHEVRLARPFQVARYEVPQNLWEAVMESNPSKWKGPRNSVEMLSFEEALEFCRRSTTLMRAASLIDDDEQIRLPSEAEWEYVARAGTETTYSFGDDSSQLTEFAWFTNNAAGNDPPVGAKKPNPWGLYDIHGYLWEWCLDEAHDSYEGAPTDGSPWCKVPFQLFATDAKATGQRILRGGSWKDPADRLTSSYRRFVDADLRDDAVGLRCVLDKVRK